MPKNLYKTSLLDSERDAVAGDEGEEHMHVNQDMYKAVEVRPGEYFEVVLKNNDLKSILTWDFDVLNLDVKFTVLRTMGLAKDSSPRPEDRLSSKASVLEESKLIEDGVDFVREEPTLTCRPKESVQVGGIIFLRTNNYKRNLKFGFL